MDAPVKRMIAVIKQNITKSGNQVIKVLDNAETTRFVISGSYATIPQAIKVVARPKQDGDHLLLDIAHSALPYATCSKPLKREVIRRGKDTYVSYIMPVRVPDVPYDGCFMKSSATGKACGTMAYNEEDLKRRGHGGDV